MAYTPAHFATTEPFLLLFFVMYCTIAVLFAHRQPLQLRGFIDGPLVFGLPIVASSLQAYLVQDFRYGMALSALGLGVWYIGLARLLWNRFSDGMRVLCEAFLALEPPTRLRLRDGILSGTLEALTSGQADLAIGVVAETVMPENVESLPLGSQRFIFAVAPHHPLATATSALDDATIGRPRQQDVIGNGMDRNGLRGFGIQHQNTQARR